MAFYEQDELLKLGFKSLGRNVRLSKKASIYNPQYITIGDNCRIDDFSLLSANNKEINIGNYVHISAYASLVGAENICLDDFVGVSSRVSIYSSNDDYSGNHLMGPTVPDELKKVDNRPVHLAKYVVIGAGSVVLPGAKLSIGAAVGSLSLVLGKEYDEFMIYVGVPAKAIKKRADTLVKLAQRLVKNV